jgi:hypothetical protein
MAFRPRRQATQRKRGVGCSIRTSGRLQWTPLSAFSCRLRTWSSRSLPWNGNARASVRVWSPFPCRMRRTSLRRALFGPRVPASLCCGVGAPCSYLVRRNKSRGVLLPRLLPLWKANILHMFGTVTGGGFWQPKGACRLARDAHAADRGRAALRRCGNATRYGRALRPGAGRGTCDRGHAAIAGGCRFPDDLWS